MIKISIIIPIYNSAGYLEKCLNSLFGQNLREVEYIFVDDCSTDNGLVILESMIEKWAHKKNKTKLIRHEVNKGSAAARNSGLEHASGEYIGWIDSDDWIDPNMFKDMFDAAKENNADIVWTDFFNTYQEKENRIIQKAPLDSQSIIKGLMKGELLGGMCNKLIRRQLFNDYKIKFPEGLNMCEDLRVCISLFFYGQRFFYLDIAPYHYIKHRDNSISSSNVRSSDVNNEWVENVKGIERFLIDKGLAEKMQNSLLKLKLSPKKNLLINGRDVQSYKIWSRIFPESNSYVWKTNLPAHYKFIAWCADKKLWIIVRFWIFIKYTLLEK